MFRVYFLLIFLLLPQIAANALHILIIAPHPDDEAISLGAYIADRVAAGDTVTGVIITDGEAFAKAVRANRLSKKPVLTSIDFLKLGKIRRREGSLALSQMGIPSARQIFMGYPGNSLNRIYKTQNPELLIRSRATRQRYGIASWKGQRREIPFTRKTFVNDLNEILTTEKPDILIIPAAFDSNSDHYATHALIMERLKILNLKPVIKSYLVHRGSRKFYPKPYGYRPEAGIFDPVGVPAPSRYFPTQAGNIAKEKALRSHKTQIRLKDGFLLSFIRKEEIFWATNLVTSSTEPVAP